MHQMIQVFEILNLVLRDQLITSLVPAISLCQFRKKKKHHIPEKYSFEGLIHAWIGVILDFGERYISRTLTIVKQTNSSFYKVNDTHIVCHTVD